MNLLSIDENWLPIAGWEDLYEVSDFGRVRSLDRYTIYNNKIRFFEGKIHAGGFNNGYKLFQLKNKNKVKTIRANRIVAEAFIPNPENKPCVDHINCDPSDNRVQNLRWVTHKENTNNENTLLKLNKASIERGKKLRIPILKIDPVSMKVIDRFESASHAAKEMNCSMDNIWYGCKGNFNLRKNFYWRQEILI